MNDKMFYENLSKQMQEDKEKIKRLEDNWKKLKEEIDYQIARQKDIDKFAEEQGFATYNPVRLNIEHIKKKMEELEKGGSNE